MRRGDAFIRRVAEQVRALGASDGFMQAMGEARQSFFVAWVNSRDPAERERLWAEMQGLIRLQAGFQTILNRAERPERGRK